MGRRTILLIVAALIAVLGSAMVFIYVKGADNRAIQGQAPVKVLKATAAIEPGETAKDAMASGKLKLEDVPQAQVLVGAMNSVANIGSSVALSTIYPGEQIISTKFGSPGDQSSLTMPNPKELAVSMSLSDTGRVAGFVSPGNDVAVFATCDETDSEGSKTYTLFSKVPVIAVGATTITNTTVTDQSGTSTTEQLPKTLFTLSLNQEDAQKLIQAASSCELAYGLLSKTSQVKTPLPPASLQSLFR
ncbi:MAG: Flp pilus assembly protein CpaB [Nocardioidaceae bacterium]|nr:MAG: Flp pilus assembly protein CpaB [Nocardioidaceae bacterium]